MLPGAAAGRESAAACAQVVGTRARFLRSAKSESARRKFEALRGYADSVHRLRGAGARGVAGARDALDLDRSQVFTWCEMGGAVAGGMLAIWLRNTWAGNSAEVDRIVVGPVAHGRFAGTCAPKIRTLGVRVYGMTGTQLKSVVAVIADMSVEARGFLSGF